MSRLRILFLASECVPVVKTGGLGDVVGALSAQLLRRGHDVRVVMPRYRVAKRYAATRLPTPLAVPVTADREAAKRWAAVWQGELLGGVPVYLIEHDALYDRDGIYGDRHRGFGDNALRYAFLARASLALTHALSFEPDILHAHDWQAALLPVLARLQGHPAASVLTLHNLGYQGRLAAGDAASLGLTWEELCRSGIEHFGRLNLLKGGICSATMLSTVSPRYAQEVQTPMGGAGLDAELRWRAADLVGILNGIDEVVWDPSRDEHLAQCYSADDLAGKLQCKQALQSELGLALDASAPLIGIVSRLVDQKGIDVVLEAMAAMLHTGAQFAILGDGADWAKRALQQLAHASPQVRVRFGLDEGLAHRIEAGADFFLMPSRYEPCGLNQMYSQRYGTLPIVRAVGGLRDSVKHGVDGFVFEALSGDALAAVVEQAITVYRQRPAEFRQMQFTAMRKRMGWDRAASQYEALYRLAQRRRRGRSADA